MPPTLFIKSIYMLCFSTFPYERKVLLQEFKFTGMTQWSKFEFANPAIQMIQYTDTVQYVRSIQFSTVRIAEL